MGKKGGKKASGSASADAPTSSAVTAAAMPKATSWAEALELDPKKKEHEEKLMKERQAKAEAAAKAQAKQNEKYQWWEKEQQKELRKKDREDKQWQAQAMAIKNKALQDGVVEAEDWGDGSWWVDLGKGKWQEVQGQYFCTLCEKHLSDYTLKSHIDSDAHQRKVSWAAGGGGGATGETPAAPAAAAARSQVAPTAQSASQQWSGQLEDWQEITPEGFWRCIPCGKVIDECHLATADHSNRLASWIAQTRKAKCNYPAPALPYLAEVPQDENDPTSARWPKCLLCNKWCQDEVSHSGTHANPAGSKEHQKNLRNYLPGTPWYEEKVTQVRNRWHPPAKAAAPPSQPKPPSPAPWASAASSAAPGPAAKNRQAPPSPADALPAGPPLPRDWFSATDTATGRMYYYNRAGERTWNHPGLPAAPPSSGSSSGAPAAAAASAASAAAAAAAAPADDEVEEC